MPTESEGPVRHVVVFKYKRTAIPDHIRQVTEAFGELPAKIPGVLAYEHGVNNSPEKKNHGFSHAYTVLLESLAARDVYLTHPAHLEFQALLARLDVLKDAFVIDYHPLPGSRPTDTPEA